MFGGALKIERAVDMYLLSLRLEGRAETTRKNYAHVLMALCDHFSGKAVHRIRADALHVYLAALGNRVAERSLGTYILTIRRFLDWLTERGYIKRNPLSSLIVHTPPDEPVAPFTDGEVAHLLASVKTPLENLLLVLLLDCGMRASEVASLQAQDIDLWAGEILIRHGKGGKSRRMALNPVPRQALRDYLANGAQGDGLWPQGWNRHHVARTLDKIAKRAGVAKVHPHRFRHHWAIQLSRAGVDSLAIQQLAGWSSLKMVQRYTRFVQQECAVEVHRQHPIAS